MGYARWVMRGGGQGVGVTQGGLCKVGGRVWGSREVDHVRWVT